MTPPKHYILLKALALWAAIAAFGAVGGWGVSFFGYGALPVSILYGWFSGKMLARLGADNPIVTAVLIFTSGIIARLAVGAYLLRHPDTPVPPYGAWQTIIDMFTPWPIPSIGLFAISVTAIISLKYSIKKQTRGINPCEQQSHQ